MTTEITIPLWLLVLVLAFAAITVASHFLFPSVRWFFRRRAQRVVAKLNERLERPIEPFKLAKRHDMIQRLVYHSDVMEAVTQYAAEEGVPEDVAFEKAQYYAREIVPSFSATGYFGIGTRAAKFISQAFYRVRMGHEDEALKDVDPDATVVFVMNHRSNMDYVLVTHLAANRSALSYAVGEWARVWPLSRFIQSMGAYFIRRKSRGILYRRVLARYVQMATEGGVTQAVFPEGGLSLTGDLAEPKVGLLAYVIGAYTPGGRDVVFVPVAVNYDRVLEDNILIAAGERGDRRFGAKSSVLIKFWMRHMWQRLRGRYHKFGYAAASFGKPLSLSEWHEDHGTTDPMKVAQNLMGRIGSVMPVLPVPLVASFLVDQRTWDRIDLEAKALEKVATLEGGYVHIPRDDFGYALDYGLRNLAERGVISMADNQITVTEGQAHLLQYYAASLNHLVKKSDAT
ncbi:MAG: 1-acyl-sn-glycerol-3-phosphate acyltransferase [Planktomarina sp.]